MYVLLFVFTAPIADAPQRSPFEYVCYAILAVILLFAARTFNLEASANAYADALDDAQCPELTIARRYDPHAIDAEDNRNHSFVLGLMAMEDRYEATHRRMLETGGVPVTPDEGLQFMVMRDDVARLIGDVEELAATPPPAAHGPDCQCDDCFRSLLGS